MFIAATDDPDSEDLLALFNLANNAIAKSHYLEEGQQLRHWILPPDWRISRELTTKELDQATLDARAAQRALSRGELDEEEGFGKRQAFIETLSPVLANVPVARRPEQRETLWKLCILRTNLIRAGAGGQAPATLKSARECMKLFPEKPRPSTEAGWLAEEIEPFDIVYSEQDHGRLRIRSNPAGCRPYINGHYVDEPTPTALFLRPGSYTVQLQCGARLGFLHRAIVKARSTTYVDLDAETELALTWQPTGWTRSWHTHIPLLPEGPAEQTQQRAARLGRLAGMPQVILARRLDATTWSIDLLRLTADETLIERQGEIDAALLHIDEREASELDEDESPYLITLRVVGGQPLIDRYQEDRFTVVWIKTPEEKRGWRLNYGIGGTLIGLGLATVIGVPVWGARSGGNSCSTAETICFTTKNRAAIAGYTALGAVVGLAGAATLIWTPFSAVVTRDTAMLQYTRKF